MNLCYRWRMQKSTAQWVWSSIQIRPTTAIWSVRMCCVLCCVDSDINRMLLQGRPIRVARGVQAMRCKCVFISLFRLHWFMFIVYICFCCVLSERFFVHVWWPVDTRFRCCWLGYVSSSIDFFLWRFIFQHWVCQFLNVCLLRWFRCSSYF